MVVGVTNEAEGLVRGWVEENKVEFPVAIVTGKETDQAYDVKGFPSGALVGADGNLLWLGHPASLAESEIEAALEKATFVPLLPAKYAAINADIVRKDFGKAYAAIEKALAKGDDEALSRAKESIEKLAAARAADADAKAQAGDYAGAAEVLEETAKQFKGMPVAEDAAKTLKEWKADKEIREQIKAGEMLRKAEALERTGDAAAKKKAYQIYADLAKKHKGTPLGEKAQAAADRLKGS